MLVDGHLVVGLCISVDGIAAGLEHLDEAIAQLRAAPALTRGWRPGCRRGALVPPGVRRCGKHRRKNDAAAGGDSIVPPLAEPRQE